MDRGDEKYDPSFFLPLFSYLLDSSERPKEDVCVRFFLIFVTGCLVDCMRFVEHGCFTFLLASITSEQEDMRGAGYHCLSRFLSHLEAVRLREKSQVRSIDSLFNL